ncbi:MAG: tRNA (adenosine(37)-N6)-threonylcarbamoyltransferase complex ATPase subunit type 1 TsaE [Oscillospiraceae bacterium]|nr:tRNA (adenosine(37)-N6)-threonylcarbamoyltransferase complex ATPase subunit type 1 TsaE [Oscillospiraceae bacterium]
MELKVSSVEETLKAGETFAEGLNKDSVVLLYGEMGAGKTHFIKGMARGLNITDNITSPTFALVNEFPGLIHFDLFRIHTADDLYAIGFYDYIGKGIIAIEWAENIPELADDFEKIHTVKIEKIGKNERIISIDYSRT